MFGPLRFGKFLCAVALAGTTLAQTINIAHPEPGAAVIARQAFDITLESQPPLIEHYPVNEYSILIGMHSCAETPCSDSTYLGTVLHSGVYSFPSGGRENISVVATSDFNGPGLITIVRFFTTGAYNIPHMETTNVAITLNNLGGG